MGKKITKKRKRKKARGTLTFVDGKFPVPQRDPSGKNVERKTQKRVELRN